MALSLEPYRRYGWSEEDTMKGLLTKRIERQRKRSFGVTLKNGDRIPNHLIIEILSWLPVRTLLQFKSVSKLWYAMIKSSHFISKHLRNYHDNNSSWRECLNLQYKEYEYDTLQYVYELLLDNKRNRVLSYQEIETAVYNTFLCGPCNGIYYLACNRSPKRTLWNPTLNELKILQHINWKPKFPHSYYEIVESYGFGYDSKSKDYKVIFIMGYRRDEGSCPMSIFIYSLKTNSWRHWGDMDRSYDLEQNKNYVFVNGCYHWIGSLDYGRSYEMLTSFDISEEVYKEIPLPQFEKEPDERSRLLVYHGSIDFVYVHPQYRRSNSSFSVWTWNGEIWTQKLRMKLKFRVCGTLFSQWRDETLSFTRQDGKLVLCDTNTKKILFLDGPQRYEIDNICAYKESLVSINDFN